MQLPPSDFHKTQKRKNLALLTVLLAMMLLVFAITLMKIQDSGKKAEGRPPSSAWIPNLKPDA